MFVVIGAGGFLGSEFIYSVLKKSDEKILAVARSRNVACEENERVEVLTGDLRETAFLDEVAAKINTSDNVKIFWTAACHNIDFVAENPDAAHYMNVEVPEYLLSRIKNINKLFFTSSDTVYGEGGEYLFKEDDALSPVSVYGMQKAEAEKVFAKYGGVSLRLPLMFSFSKAPSKKHFCDTVAENLRNGRETTLVTGFLRSVLDYKTVADVTAELFYKESLPSVINVAGDESLSKYKLGLLLAEKLGCDASFIISAEKWGEFREGAMRTDSTLLDNSLVKKILGREELKINL